jgi:hypothetical protein
LICSAKSLRINLMFLYSFLTGDIAEKKIPPLSLGFSLSFLAGGHEGAPLQFRSLTLFLFLYLVRAFGTVY